ncbi:MAG TPA: serine/threonine-protein kinase, partial [Pyrinomonadaceae bacterium]|nr:serine/threonine-protein kinase [Pyrinomonadaceae bacterium]
MLQCPQCGRQFAAETTVCPDDGAALMADSTTATEMPVDPLAGRVLDDKYRLDERLGEGGMGTVYRATHLLIERPVAVKVLNPKLVTDEAARERFRREARAAGRLQHSNAVAVTDFGETRDGLVYIVMELLEGYSLRDVIAREAPLDPARAVSVMMQVAAATSAAHEAGIIHRDLKPGNIFVVQRPHAPHIVKVLDYGIAKLAAGEDGSPHDTLTGAGVMIGTPRYMSPEQCDSAPLTPASDVYSMGVILYELLTGQTPFTGTTPLSLALKHSAEVPRPPRELVTTVPPALEEVVLHALAKSPRDRPADAGEFRRELYSVAERLGLEHAAGFSAPTVEMLREAGTTTPSGRLVIDIERMRRNRAATTGESPVVANTADALAVKTGGGPAQRAASSSSSSSSHAVGGGPRFENARGHATTGAVLPPRRAGQSLGAWLRQPPVIVAGVVLLLLVVSAAYAAWRSARAPEGAAATARGDDADETVGRSITQGESAPRGSAYPEPKTAAEFYENGTYYFSVRSYDAAVRDFRRAVELQPEFPSAHNRLGRALMLKGQLSAAADSFRTAIRQQGGNYPVAQYNLGFALQQQGDAENAVNAYRDAIRSRGGNYPDAHFQIGAILRADPARRPEAIDALRKAIEQSGGRDPEAHLVLGVALAEQKDYQNAEAAMREAINQRGGDFPYAHYN